MDGHLIINGPVDNHETTHIGNKQKDGDNLETKPAFNQCLSQVFTVLTKRIMSIQFQKLRRIFHPDLTIMTISTNRKISVKTKIVTSQTIRTYFLEPTYYKRRYTRQEVSSHLGLLETADDSRFCAQERYRPLVAFQKQV